MHRQRSLRALLTWAISFVSSGLVSARSFNRHHRIPSNYSGEAQKLADPNFGPVPGKSDIYSTYDGIPRPFPGNFRDPIFPTKKGHPDPNDHVWQNLLSAEWVIFELYQQGVEKLTTEDFAKINMPSNTHKRLMEIRNNEAGHLRIFQNMISPTSVKPGPCKYNFPFTDAASFLSLVTVVEISSMIFLTGLVQQPDRDFDKGALTAISQTEARHETWALIDVWKTNPFGGPSDTNFPYANQILDGTNMFIVEGSCPPENPEYPHPRQGLTHYLTAAKGTKSLTPGSTVTLDFVSKNNTKPIFHPHTKYYAVFFHGMYNVSVPLNTTGFPKRPIQVTVPREFETRGAIVALIADTPGAPTEESVVVGPSVILEQPWQVGAGLIGGGGGSNQWFKQRLSRYAAVSIEYLLRLNF
ncbi:hypothetical protein N0V88_007851 [Collariella sp. IMI 366227]|nr:hypothetical protein N0V88_007851 [Collariella sp. IMI 366227]